MKKPKNIELEVKSGDKMVKIVGQNCTVKKKWFQFGKKNEFMACEDFQVSDDGDQVEERAVEDIRQKERDDDTDDRRPLSSRERNFPERRRESDRAPENADRRRQNDRAPENDRPEPERRPRRDDQRTRDDRY